MKVFTLLHAMMQLSIISSRCISRIDSFFAVLYCLVCIVSTFLPLVLFPIHRVSTFSADQTQINSQPVLAYQNCAVHRNKVQYDTGSRCHAINSCHRNTDAVSQTVWAESEQGQICLYISALKLEFSETYIYTSLYHNHLQLLRTFTMSQGTI